MAPFSNVTDPYIFIRASLIVTGLSNDSIYRSKQSGNFLNAVFILLLILGLSFTPEKNVFAFCKENLKSFAEKL
jgi:hypothetical protein